MNSELFLQWIPLNETTDKTAPVVQRTIKKVLACAAYTTEDPVDEGR